MFVDAKATRSGNCGENGMHARRMRRASAGTPVLNLRVRLSGVSGIEWAGARSRSARPAVVTVYMVDMDRVDLQQEVLTLRARVDHLVA
jgi:hypothetical protein